MDGFFLVPSSTWVRQKKRRRPEPSVHLRINENRMEPKHIEASRGTSWIDLRFPDLCPTLSWIHAASPPLDTSGEGLTPHCGTDLPRAGLWYYSNGK